jgi:hypothetical protein
LHQLGGMVGCGRLGKRKSTFGEGWMKEWRGRLGEMKAPSCFAKAVSAGWGGGALSSRKAEAR